MTHCGPYVAAARAPCGGLYVRTDRVPTPELVAPSYIAQIADNSAIFTCTLLNVRELP